MSSCLWALPARPGRAYLSSPPTPHALAVSTEYQLVPEHKLSACFSPLSSGLPGGSQVTSFIGDALAMVELGAGTEGRLRGHRELGAEPAAAPHSLLKPFSRPCLRSWASGGVPGAGGG